MATGVIAWTDRHITRVLPHLDPPRPHERLLLLAAVLAAVVLVVGLGFVALTGDAGDETRARTDCRGFVEAQLKSPASAEFSDEQVSQDGDRYVVNGVVDADNAFGASLRNEFRCEVAINGNRTDLVSLTGLTE